MYSVMLVAVQKLQLARPTGQLDEEGVGGLIDVAEADGVRRQDLTAAFVARHQPRLGPLVEAHRAAGPQLLVHRMRVLVADREERLDRRRLMAAVSHLARG